MPPASPRVLVTRARHQASDLADRLRALGVEPVIVPAIETMEPASFAALDEAVAHLDSFHWLLFTSGNAVEAFAARCESHATARSRPQIAVIGPATAAALSRLGLKPDLLPPQAVAESLAEALLPYARQPDGTSTRFLLIRAEEAREHLPETLRAAGAEVRIAPAYRTVIPAESVELIARLFGKGAAQSRDAAIDAITFTSSSGARNLIALCEAANVTLPGNALRVSIGPITSQTLRDLGLAPHAEAPAATVAALVETVGKALNFFV